MWTHDPAAESSPHGRGFKLIELVVAVAIPSYQSQVRKSARAEAQAFINDDATRQQQFLVDRRSYATSLARLGTPADLATKCVFAVATTAGSPPSYQLTATAIGAAAYYL